LLRQLLENTFGSFASPEREAKKTNASNRTAVFILSSPHSGSTWTGYVLGSNPASAFLGEYHRAWKDRYRTPCIVCNARGFGFCEVLSDLGHEPVERAFDLAFARTGKRVVVDSSKDVDWIQSFRGDDTFDIRLVHLVRDPRGFFASAKRRVTDGLDHVMSKWCKENEDLRDFIAASGLRSVTASYDLLAQSPETEFRRVFERCGMAFTEECLRYWDVEHHAWAANGASDAILKGKGHGDLVATGDVDFYQRKSQTLFHDLRWRSALTPAQSTTIESNNRVRRLLRSLGYSLTDSGIQKAPSRFALARSSLTRHGRVTLSHGRVPS
jgi:hypothetical protein